MKNIVKTCTVLLFVITAGVMMIPSFTDSAGAQQCFLEICKSAPGAGETGFTILIDDGGMISVVELFDGGDCFTESFFSTDDFEVTEEPAEGWVLQDVICDPNPGFSISNIQGGIDADCITSAEASTTCTFVNGPAASNIPTLSEWGMISAAVGLVLIGVFYALKKRRMQAA